MPSPMATVALVAKLDRAARWGVGVSPGENRGRGYVLSTGDGCVEFTGKRRRGNTAPRGRDCREEGQVCLRAASRLASPAGVSPVGPDVEGNSRAGTASLSLPPPWCLCRCLFLDLRGDSSTPSSPFPSFPPPFRLSGSVMSRGTRISMGSPPRDGRGEDCGVSWLVALNEE